MNTLEPLTFINPKLQSLFPAPLVLRFVGGRPYLALRWQFAGIDWWYGRIDKSHRHKDRVLKGLVESPQSGS